MTFKTISLVTLTIILGLFAALQQARGDAPFGMEPITLTELGDGSLVELDEFIMPQPPVEALLAEDAAWGASALPTDRRRRVALPQPMPLDLLQDAARTEVADGMVHRILVTSPGAVFQSFKFSAFELPTGARLTFVSVDRTYQDGPYDARHNRPERRFGSPMVPGQSAVIELFVPTAAATAGIALELESVSYGYRDVLRMGSFPQRSLAAPTRAAMPAPVPAPVPGPTPQPASGGPFSCQRDVNCPEGDDYQDVKRAVAEGYDGSFICSGTMINNTAEDDRYLYITAAHCGWWADPAGMSYYWGYENSGCGTNDAPLNFSTGSANLWWDIDADIHLLELSGTDIDETFDIYYAGWSRSPAVPSEGAILSFPDDKPMQIAVSFGPVQDCEPSGCPGGWGEDFWRLEDYDIGMTEGGSSGGCLLDENHHLIGVLTGGVGTNCNDFDWDEYAKIHKQWADLGPYLDPTSSGVMKLDGRDHDESTAISSCQGIDGIDVVTVLTGGLDIESAHVVPADAADSLSFFIDKPAGPGNGKFVAHLNAGTPSQTTITTLPAQLDESCFPFLIAPSGTATPSAVWNRIGKADKVGSSEFFGAGIPDPARAPTTFYSVASVDVGNMPIGSRWTLQAVIINAGATSPKGVSVTDAVIVEIQ